MRELMNYFVGGIVLVTSPVWFPLWLFGIVAFVSIDYVHYVGESVINSFLESWRAR